MGWFATYKALKDGSGPYGTVEQSLKRECDPPRTLRIALDAIDRDDPVSLPEDAKKRIEYWKRRAE